jgi:hypothetical protein
MLTQRVTGRQVRCEGEEIVDIDCRDIESQGVGYFEKIG